MNNKEDWEKLFALAVNNGIGRYDGSYEQAYDNIVNLFKKQDKMIDLMTETFYKKFKAELLLEYGFENEEQLKQYFKEIAERKSEEWLK